MLYPRTARVGEKDILVNENQMISYREHMIQEHRILFLNGIIGARCANCGQGETDSINLLLALNSLSHDPIKLIITSPGGDLDTTFLFIDTMKLIQSPVITIGRYCASAACLILASGQERYLYPHARTMLHLATGQMMGDYKDYAIQHRLMVNYQDKIVDILTEAGVKKSKDEILADIDRDFWLDPQEAIDYGLADKIMKPEILQEWMGE